MPPAPTYPEGWTLGAPEAVSQCRRTTRSRPTASSNTSIFSFRPTSPSRSGCVRSKCGRDVAPRCTTCSSTTGPRRACSAPPCRSPTPPSRQSRRPRPRASGSARRDPACRRGVVSTAWYDNSAANKSNPDSTVDVKWGDQTWEEMQYTGILFSPKHPPVPTPPVGVKSRELALLRPQPARHDSQPGGSRSPFSCRRTTSAAISGSKWVPAPLRMSSIASGTGMAAR